MAKNKPKKPRQSVSPTGGKQAKSTVQAEIDQQYVLWSFALFDDCSHWAGKSPEDSHFCSVAKHLRDYQGRPWSEIMGNASRDHFVPIDRLTPEAQARLESLQYEDVDELLRFRCSNLQRIWGIKSGSVFHVIWWDPEHRVCPAELKNT